MANRHRSPLLVGALWAAAWAIGAERTDAATWRVGDADQPWRLHPVSFLLDAGEVFKPDFIWGGAHAVEVVVDDDGDGQIDEDPVDVVDDDGDGLFNEDAADGIDNDRDGQVDEDGADPQFDNDGDGLLNEDGLRTGGVIDDAQLRTAMKDAPFFRHETAAEAAADPGGPGYGWGDDDHDVSFNEDPLDGRDNDGDGLADEDPPGHPVPLPATWTVSTFAYGGEAYTPAQRQAIAFTWEPATSTYTGQGPDGASLTARASNLRFTPTDWLRPIRLDPSRNITLLTTERFLSGIWSNVNPLDSQSWGTTLTGTTFEGTSGYGQVADGDIFTARAVSQRSSSAYFRVHFLALYWLDLIRFRPRPDFPDRTPTSFDLWYAGDKANHYRQVFVLEELRTRMVVSDPIVPRQIDQPRPPIKEYRFGENEDYPPTKARILVFGSQMPEGQTWELSEFAVYGHGYALDGAYTTEIIDVGPARPRFRRYFDAVDPTLPVALETAQTKDDNDDGTVTGAELASVKLAAQFDPDLDGSPATWGRVRWRGRVEGDEANVRVRVRSGTSLDTRIYQRKVGRGVVSPFIGPSLVADWPAPGSRLDVFSYLQLPGLERAPVKDLPPNLITDRDGSPGGWTPWSAPIDFAEGDVELGGSGLLMPLPPLHRYIQFHFDFESGEASGISLDYLEFDYAAPIVSRGVLAEIFPDTAAVLGQPAAFRYVLKPAVDRTDVGFDRIDIAVPTPDAKIDTLLIDDLGWTRALPVAPGGLDAAEADAWVRERLHSGAWLDTVAVSGTRYAAATYFDSAAQAYKIGIKTRVLTSDDFPLGQDREIEVGLTTPVFRLLTGFDSWIWNQATAADLQQPTQPGNASDRLPSDAVRVTVQGTGKTVTLREVVPNPFTPNSDGRNDRAVWTVDIFLLTSPSDISVTVFSVDGRQVRKLEQPAAAGQVTLTWDGRDEAGQLVPPGLYVYRLFVDSDTDQSKEQIGTVAVAY